MIYIKAILTASATIAASYLITSFIMWDIDASAWPHEVRFLMAFFGVLAAMVLALLTVEIVKINMSADEAIKKIMEARK